MSRLTLDYLVTRYIIYINVLVYALMVFFTLSFQDFSSNFLIYIGANVKPLTTNGEWWRLITCTFIHSSFMHLASNMLGLIFIGLILEPVLGRARFIIGYLFSAVTASFASIFWYQNIISVGASGAIFGLYGLFMTLIIKRVFSPVFGSFFFIGTALFVGYNLFNGFTVTGIDNAAHIGGLLGGIIIGFPLSLGLKAKINNNKNIFHDY